MRAFALLFFMCGIWIGQTIATSSWNGTVYVSLSSPRSPASSQQATGSPIVAIPRTAFTQSIQEQILSGALVHKQNGYVGIQLGHPLLSGDHGKVFACELQGRPGAFDHAQLVFSGVGISESGEAPLLIAESVCRASDRVGLLQPVWIPMQDITGAEPKDQELQVYVGSDPVFVRLEHIPSQWPSEWVLISVRFYQEDSAQEGLVIDARKMREASGLLRFDFALAPAH